jgi:hypothetical protein
VVWVLEPGLNSRALTGLTPGLQISSVTAKVPFSMIMLIDAAKKKAIPPDFHCRQVDFYCLRIVVSQAPEHLLPNCQT